MKVEGDFVNNGTSFIDSLVENLNKDIKNKRAEILKEIFAERGLTYLLDELETRRFKRVMFCKDKLTEEVWIDDGTDNGKLILIFELYITTNTVGHFVANLQYREF